MNIGGGFWFRVGLGFLSAEFWFVSFANLKQFLNKLEYSKYGWHIFGDLKVMPLLVGLQLE